jgi:hypothetical protein
VDVRQRTVRLRHMLARRVIALSADKAFGKVMSTALKAAGGVVELHQGVDGLGRGDIQAALVVVHLDGELVSVVEDLALRLGNDARMIVILPTSALSKTVDVMKISDRVAGILIQAHMKPIDLAAMATRILAGDIFGVEKLVPWGTRIYSTLVGDYQEKSLCIAQITEYAELMGVRRKYREAIEQCVDEMLMNALYDAPVDDQGKQIFAEIPTKSRIQLRMEQKVVVQYACDGQTFTVSVRDSFGTLDRTTVLRYLWKCLHSEQQIDRKTGGAGLGLYLIASNSTRFLYNVLPDVATECVCQFDLETPKVQLEGFGFFSEKIDAAGRLAAGPSRLLPQGVGHPVERRTGNRGGPAQRTPRGMIGALSAAIVLLLALIVMVAWPRFTRTPTTSVTIATEPAGATVEIDGSARGVATTGALTVGGLQVGRAYRVVARLDGHSPAETVFQPAEGPPTNLQLRLVPRTSTVLIDSDPRGAAVLAGGVEVGITPVTITTFTPSSEVPVTFRHGGYAEVTRSIRVPAPGGEAQVMQSLTMDAAFATLLVTSEPAGADVWIDGQRQIGVTTPTRELLVEAGKRHSVSVRLARHAPITVSVSPGQGARNVPVHAALVPGAAITMSANMDARATVTIAGEAMKGCTKRPLPFDCPVPAGKYQVDIETTKMTGKVRRQVEVKDDVVEVSVELGWVEAPSGKQLVFGGHETSRVAFEEGKRQVTVLDEAAGTTSTIDVRVQTGRATAIP